MNERDKERLAEIIGTLEGIQKGLIQIQINEGYNK